VAADNYITELLGYIGLDVDKGSFGEADDAIGAIHAGMAGVIAIAGAMSAAVIAAGFSLVNEFTETAVEADTLAKRVGVTTQQLQSLTYAASTFGIEQDALVDGMKELSLRTDEFVKTGKGSGAESFQRLGLGQKQLAAYTNDTNGLFDVLLEKLRGVQDTAARQRLADELFGGTAAEQFIPMLTASGASIAELRKEAEDLGIVMSADGVKAAKQYSVELMRLRGIVNGIRNQIAERIIPVFADFAKRFREFFTNNSKAIVDALTVAFNALAGSIKYLGIMAAIALPYLIGSAAIAGYTRLISLLGALRAAFIAVRTGAILAWAAAYAGPALIGAAILGIILALQDVYTYLNGGKSVTGLLVKKFSDAADAIRKKWTELKDWFKGIFDQISQWAEGMIPDWLKKVLTDGNVIGPNAVSTEQPLRFLAPGMPGLQGPAGTPGQNGSVIPAPQAYSTAPAPSSSATNVVNTNNTTSGGNTIHVGVTTNDENYTKRLIDSYIQQGNARVVKNVGNGMDY